MCDHLLGHSAFDRTLPPAAARPRPMNGHFPVPPCPSPPDSRHQSSPSSSQSASSSAGLWTTGRPNGTGGGRPLDGHWTLANGRTMAQQPNGRAQPQQLRLAVVGLGGVGKSALTIQFVQQYFVMDYDPTIADSYTKSFFVDETMYRLEVTDTAGQDEHSALREQYLRSGDGFLLVFSVTNRHSLEYVLRLRKTIERIKDRDHFPMVLVGNKCDLDADRQISRNEAENLATCLHMPYMETSAKYRQNVDQIFRLLIQQIRQFRQMERCGNGQPLATERGREMVDCGAAKGAKRAVGQEKRAKAKKEKGSKCRIQ